MTELRRNSGAVWPLCGLMLEHQARVLNTWFPACVVFRGCGRVRDEACLLEVGHQGQTHEG